MQHIKTLFFTLFLLSFSVATFAQATVKVQGAVGEVTFQKKKSSEWSKVKVGLKLKQEEKLRTGVESQVTLLFDNGSVITVAENSILSVDKLLSEGKDSQTRVNVKTGKVLFNIQKLTTGKSSFEFQAQSATAAIRGTQGEFQVRGRRTLASLLTGKLELRSERGGVTIGGGQIALQTNSGFKVIVRPEDPKEYEALVQNYLSDTTEVIDTTTYDSTVVDTSIVLDSAQNQELDNALIPEGSCVINPIPAKIEATKIKVSGKAIPGSEIVIENMRTQVSSSGEWSMDIAWDASKPGLRSFSVKQVVQDKEKPCGTISFEYTAPIIPLAIKLNSPNPANICKGPLVISGKYEGTGARLQMKIGNTPYDLSSVTGSFEKTVSISDKERNWDLSKIDLILTNSTGSISKEISLNIDKKCREVNQTPPTVELAAIPGTCQAVATINSTNGDETEAFWYADGVELKRYPMASDMRVLRLDLAEGLRQYTIRVLDLAGNKAEAKLAKLACYPDVRFDIRLEGANSETILLPPGPPGRTLEIRKVVRFSVENLPRNDYGYLKRVTIRLAGKVIKEWRENQITSHTFDMDVTLQKGKSNILQIEVEHQNGRIRTVQKEFLFK